MLLICTVEERSVFAVNHIYWLALKVVDLVWTRELILQSSRRRQALRWQLPMKRLILVLPSECLRLAVIL
jgi:hypothetical protein